MPLTSDVSINVAIGGGVTLSNTFTRPQNINAPGVVDWKLFPVGFTLLTAPPGVTTGLLIIPADTNLNQIALVGDANDDPGIVIHPSDVTFLSLPNTPVVGIRITGGATLIRLVWV